MPHRITCQIEEFKKSIYSFTAGSAIGGLNMVKVISWRASFTTNKLLGIQTSTTYSLWQRTEFYYHKYEYRPSKSPL